MSNEKLDRIIELLLEIKRLMEKEKGTFPYIPPHPYNPNENPWTIPYMEKKSCPKCGLNLEGVMGYVCTNPGCPTFPQVTC